LIHLFGIDHHFVHLVEIYGKERKRMRKITPPPTPICDFSYGGG
jgi:hypothetical protein